MPWTRLVRSANARHGAGPGSAQIALASAACSSDLPVDEIGKNRSGSADRQAASCHHLPSAISRATSARYGDSRAAASSRRLGRGYALRAPRPTRKERALAALRAALLKHVGESMRQTRTACPGAVTGTRRSAILGDGKGWPEPAHARLPAEDRFCGAAVARITMIRRRLVTCLAASLVVARLPAGNFSSGLTGRARLGALPSRPAPAHHRRKNHPHAPYLHHRIHLRTRPRRRRCPHQ